MIMMIMVAKSHLAVTGTGHNGAQATCIVKQQKKPRQQWTITFFPKAKGAMIRFKAFPNAGTLNISKLNHERHVTPTFHWFVLVCFFFPSCPRASIKLHFLLGAKA